MSKIKRKITKFDFSNEGAHVALVGQAANLQSVLIMKAKSDNEIMVDAFSNDNILIKKALEQVQVSLSFEEFLRRFFGMYYDDAEMLTKLLGFQTEYEASEEEDNGETESYSDWLENRISKFSIMKSLHDGDTEEIAVSDFIEIVNLQETFEKNLKKQEGKMPKEDKTNDPTVIEISKADYDVLQKALEDLKEIKKQNDILIKERETAITKALTDKVNKFSFVDRKADMVTLVKQMDEPAQTLIFEVLEKASVAIDESVTGTMSGNEEIDLNKSSDFEKSKSFIRDEFAKKYKLSDK